jgi:transcriptional regulator with XRE-family HTH domain
MTTSTPVSPLAWTEGAEIRSLLQQMAPTNVGQRLKELRDERKLSQESLAGLIGVRARTISRWETGATSGLYDDNNLERVAKALRVKPEQIVGPPRAARRLARNDFNELQEQLDRVEETQAELNLKLDAILLHFEITAAEIELAEQDAAEARAAEGPQAA